MSDDTRPHGIPTPESLDTMRCEEIKRALGEPSALRLAVGVLGKTAEAIIPDNLLPYTPSTDPCRTSALDDAAALALKGFRAANHAVWGDGQEAHPSGNAPRQFTPLEPGKTGFFKQ